MFWIICSKYHTRSAITSCPIRPILAVRRGIVCSVYPIGIDRSGRRIEVCEFRFPSKLIPDSTLCRTNTRCAVDSSKIARIYITGFTECQRIVGDPSCSVYRIINEGGVGSRVHVSISELTVTIASETVYATEVRRDEATMRSTTYDVEHIADTK